MILLEDNGANGQTSVGRSNGTFFFHQIIKKHAGLLVQKYLCLLRHQIMYKKLLEEYYLILLLFLSVH